MSQEQLIPALIAIAVLAFFMYRRWQDQQALSARGVSVTGMVMDRDFSWDSDSNSSTYYLTIEYTVNGTVYRKKTSVPQEIYDAASTKSPIDIVYLPDNPNTFDLKFV